MFASTTKRDIAIGAETVTIRKLSAHRLGEAQLVRQKALIDLSKTLGGLNVSREDLEKFRGQEQTEEEKKRTRNALYDRLSVLKYGIHSWSVGDQVTNELVEDLDQPTAQRLFEEILDLTFEDTETRKKD